MYVPFESLPDDARIWIYQSDKKFSDQEVQKADEILKGFIEQWAAHGNPLKASFKIEHNQFLVIGVDESFAGVSGCSIDASVAATRQLENEFGVNLLDRSKVAFLGDTNEVFVVALNDLKQTHHNNTWGAATTTFNNLVSNKQEFEKNWKVPASQTWLKRYLTKMTVS